MSVRDIPAVQSWRPLILTLLAMFGLALFVAWLQPVVDAAWFDLETPQRARAGELVLWTSFLIAAAFLYLIILGLTSARFGGMRQPSLIYLRRLLSFLALLSWIVVIHLSVALPGEGDPWMFAHLVDILFVASVAGLLGPVCFQLVPEARNAWAVFLLSLLVFFAALLILEPEWLVIPLVWIGVMEAPMDLVISSSFLWALPFLAPVAPLLWTMYLSPRWLKV